MALTEGATSQSKAASEIHNAARVFEAMMLDLPDLPDNSSTNLRVDYPTFGHIVGRLVKEAGARRKRSANENGRTVDDSKGEATETEIQALIAAIDPHDDRNISVTNFQSFVTSADDLIVPLLSISSVFCHTPYGMPDVRSVFKKYDKVKLQSKS